MSLKVKEGSYLTIQAWMRTQLKLTGNELLVYAIIYGFSQTENQKFTGSLQYLADWCGASKQGILKNIKSLIDKNLIEKTEMIRNGIKVCEYSCVPVTLGYNEVVTLGDQGGDLKLHNKIANKIDRNNLSKDKLYENPGKPKSLLPNSVSKSSTKDDIYVDQFMELYNSIIDSLPVIRKLTDKRKKAIIRLCKTYSIEDIEQVFHNVEESDFLCGRVTSFKADLDWILNENNFIKILEGRYAHSFNSNTGASDLGRNGRHQTIEQKKQMEEDIANGKAEKF